MQLRCDHFVDSFYFSEHMSTMLVLILKCSLKNNVNFLNKITYSIQNTGEASIKYKIQKISRKLFKNNRKRVLARDKESNIKYSR